jgi:N-acetylglutamate synthase-like GNAT family acetyltransferase
LFSIRAAQEADLKVIRRLIRKARINILGLDYRRFIVAVDQMNQVIGCGQIKVHKDGSREMASIVVDFPWQGKGVAKAIIGRLIGNEKHDLWLMCRTELVPFYEGFEFIEIFEPLEMPSFFRRIKRLWRVVVKATGGKRKLSVMVHQVDPMYSNPQKKEI